MTRCQKLKKTTLELPLLCKHLHPSNDQSDTRTYTVHALYICMRCLLHKSSKLCQMCHAAQSTSRRQTHAVTVKMRLLFKMLGVVSDRWTPATRTFPSSGNASCQVKYVMTIVNSVQARFGEYNSGRKTKRFFFIPLFCQCFFFLQMF